MTYIGVKKSFAFLIAFSLSLGNVFANPVPEREPHRPVAIKKRFFTKHENAIGKRRTIRRAVRRTSWRQFRVERRQARAARIFFKRHTRRGQRVAEYRKRAFRRITNLERRRVSNRRGAFRRQDSLHTYHRARISRSLSQGPMDHGLPKEQAQRIQAIPNKGTNEQERLQEARQRQLQEEAQHREAQLRQQAEQRQHEEERQRLQQEQIAEVRRLQEQALQLQGEEQRQLQEEQRRRQAAQVEEQRRQEEETRRQEEEQRRQEEERQRRAREEQERFQQERERREQDEELQRQHQKDVERREEQRRQEEQRRRQAAQVEEQRRREEVTRRQEEDTRTSEPDVPQGLDEADESDEMYGTCRFVPEEERDEELESQLPDYTGRDVPQEIPFLEKKNKARKPLPRASSWVRESEETRSDEDENLRRKVSLGEVEDLMARARTLTLADFGIILLDDKETEILLAQQTEDRESSSSSRDNSSRLDSIDLENSPPQRAKGTVGLGLGRRFNDFGRERVRQFSNSAGDSEGVFEEGPAALDPLFPMLRSNKNDEFSAPHMAQALLTHLKIGDFTDVTVRAMKGGFVSGTIYKITGWSQEAKSRVSFFLKYLRTGLLVDSRRCYGEVKNLRRIKGLLERHKLVQAGFSLILSVFEGQYVSKKGKKLFTIAPAAQGKSLTLIAKEFLRSVNKSTSGVKKTPDSLSQVFKNVGVALGTFQAKNIIFPEKFETAIDQYHKANVPAHADFHSDNVFWDDEKGASLIDIETLANSFDAQDKPNAPLVYDIFYFLQQADRRFKKAELKKMKALGWSMYKAFIDGYIAGFPVEHQKGLAMYLESCFRHNGDAKFVDIFPKILGHTVTWEKAPNKGYSKKIVKALQEHLSSYRTEE